MQDNCLLNVVELNAENSSKIEDLYNNFKSRSAKDYNFELMPLEFKDFQSAINQKILKGLVLFENDAAKGLLIYMIEAHNAVEINLIHIIDNERISQRRSALLEKLLDILKDNNDWQVISYPMLGIQESFVRDISLQGFRMVGQAVVRFRFSDPFSAQILNKLNPPELENGYSITAWKDEYFDSAAQIIHDTFKNTSDTNFDPRFLSLDGSKEVLHKIVDNIFGAFLPEATSVLLYNGKVEGICFANMTSALIANIPLVGVRDSYKNKGFGKYLLRNTVQNIIRYVMEGRIFAGEVNATVETNNFAALKMYRRIGFREDYTYPHAYLKRN